jgi:hypothetical protein
MQQARAVVLSRGYSARWCGLSDPRVDLGELCHVQVCDLLSGEVRNLVSVENLSGRIVSGDDAGDLGIFCRQRADASHGHRRRVLNQTSPLSKVKVRPKPKRPR